MTGRRRDAARTGLAAVAVALALAACGSGGSTTATSAGAGTTTTSGGAPGPGASTILAAATRSSQAPGEKVAIRLGVDTSALGRVDLTGTGVYDNSARTGDLRLAVSLPSSGAGSSLSGGLISGFLSGAQLDLITHDSTVYVELPSEIAELITSYTGGRPWIEANLAQLATNRSFGGLADLLNSDGGLTDPIGSLESLVKNGAQNFTKVGPATVDGVSSTEYRADVDLSALAGSLPAADRAQLAKVAGVTKVPYTIYVDGSGRIRRVSFALSPSLDGITTSVSFQTDVISYGAQSAPALPGTSETVNLASLIGALG